MRRKNIGAYLRKVFIAASLALLTAVPSLTWAFPHHGEVVVRHREYVPLRVGRGHYWYHGGAFYRRGPRGFFVTAAPIGAVVGFLPFGYGTVWLGGVPYYTYGGVYYQAVPGGYMVVQPPPGYYPPPPPPVVAPPAW